MNLTAKIQYKNFETGEFIDEKQRSYDQTVDLIKQFPWEEQREHLIVNLTNPSITIEGQNEDYLKLALFIIRISPAKYQFMVAHPGKIDPPLTPSSSTPS